MKRTHPVKLRADKEEINTLHTCVENGKKRGTFKGLVVKPVHLLLSPMVVHKD